MQEADQGPNRAERGNDLFGNEGPWTAHFASPVIRCAGLEYNGVKPGADNALGWIDRRCNRKSPDYVSRVAAGSIIG